MTHDLLATTVGRISRNSLLRASVSDDALEVLRYLERKSRAAANGPGTRSVGTRAAASVDSMYALGCCRRGRGKDAWEDVLRRYLKEKFGTSVDFSSYCGKHATRKDNPYRALLQLPIRRFVTTNYDTFLECAIAYEKSIPFEEFRIGTLSGAVASRGDNALGGHGDTSAFAHGRLDRAEDRRPRSFTQERGFLNELTSLALARQKARGRISTRAGPWPRLNTMTIWSRSRASRSGTIIGCSARLTGRESRPRPP